MGCLHPKVPRAISASNLSFRVNKPCWPLGKLYVRQIRAVILVCPKVEVNWVLVNIKNAYNHGIMEMLGYGFTFT